MTKIVFQGVCNVYHDYFELQMEATFRPSVVERKYP